MIGPEEAAEFFLHEDKSNIGLFVDRYMSQCNNDIVVFNDNVIRPMMYFVGHQWQTCQWSVAQEHLVSTKVEFALANAFCRAGFKEANNKKALVSCVSGNHHAFGAHMVNDVFETEGWASFNLGANVPTDSLVIMVDAKKPDVVALSISMINQVDDIKNCVKQIRYEFGVNAPEIIIGGGLINADDNYVARTIPALYCKNLKHLSTLIQSL